VLQPISQLFDFVAATEVGDVRLRTYLILRGKGVTQAFERFLATVHQEEVIAPLSQLLGERGT
jgi:hypothetical protein